MDFEERLSNLEQYNQRLESKLFIVENQMLKIQGENKRLKDYFVQLLESCETISNHDDKLLDLKTRFGSLESTSETYANEMKWITSNLDVLQKSKIKQIAKQGENEIEISQLKKKIAVLEDSCKIDLTMHYEDYGKDDDDGNIEDDGYDEEERDTKVFGMKVLEMINSLACENSWELLPIDTEEKLTLVVKLVFERAVSEPSHTVHCAGICKSMQRRNVNIDGVEEYLYFRRVLIIMVQQEFEKYYFYNSARDIYVKEISEADLEDIKIKKDLVQSERKAIRRSFNLIQFIGELYNLKMLTARIIHECIKRLLANADEDSMECLCKFLTGVFQNLDQDTRDRISQGPEKSEGLYDLSVYLKSLNNSLRQDKFSPRVKILMQNVIQLK